jgi:hypothetical protein
VTDKAVRYLRETSSRKEEGTPVAFRIANTEEGYQFTLDEAKEDHQVLEHEGENYLLLDTEMGEALSNATLDVQESPQGPRLALAEGGAS